MWLFVAFPCKFELDCILIWCTTFLFLGLKAKSIRLQTKKADLAGRARYESKDVGFGRRWTLR